MNRFLEFCAFLAAIAVVLTYLGVKPSHGEASSRPIIVPAPTPAQPEGRRLRPHRELVFEAAPPAPDGTEPAIDYPDALWFKNIGSKVDNSGMCVFTAFEFACLWAGLDEFRGFRDWCAAKYPGGGWPAKLAQCVTAFCKAKNIPAARFDPARHLVQYEGDDPAFIEKCLRNGWLCGCTLYHSDRYKDRAGNVLPIIYHMTNAAHLDEKLGCTLDNNFKSLEWKPREKWLQDVKYKGKYWAFAVLAVGPPPAPTR